MRHLKLLAALLAFALTATGCNYAQALNDFCDLTRSNNSEHQCRVVPNDKGKNRKDEKIERIIDRAGEGTRRRIRITEQDAEHFVTSFICRDNPGTKYESLGWSTDWLELEANPCPARPSTGDEIKDIIADIFPNDYANALVIVNCESRFDPKAIGASHNERGLFQVHPGHFDGRWQRPRGSNIANLPLVKAGFTWDDMFDPLKNTQAARIIFDDNGQKWGRRTPSSPLIWTCAQIHGIP